MLSQMKILENAKKYKKSPERICQIVDKCEQYGLPAEGNIFRRLPEDIDKLVKICEENGLDPRETRIIFKDTPETVQAVVDTCKKNGIKVEPIVFSRKPEQLEESVKYLRENFDESWVKTLAVIRDVEKLKQSMPLFKFMGLLRYMREDTAIFNLSRKEIIERTGVITSTQVGQKLHGYGQDSGIDRVNYIYRLKPDSFERFCEENHISDANRKYNYDRVEAVFKAEIKKAMMAKMTEKQKGGK